LKDNRKTLSTEQRHRIFANEFVETGDTRKSYQAAYGEDVSDHAAQTSGSRLLKNDNVQRMIEKRNNKVAKLLTISAAELTSEVVEIARDSVNDTVRLKAYDMLAKFLRMYQDNNDVNLGEAVKIVHLELPSNGRLIEHE
jgi:phage terminase small subunit